MSSLEQHWTQKVRLLTQGLIISGTINIGLIATFVYFAIKEKPTSLAYELSHLEEGAYPKKEESLTNEKLLRSLCTMSFPQLLSLLSDKEMVEEGYTKRDLALACLVCFHHFDLERALSNYPLQRRLLSFSNAQGDEKMTITVFSGLVDYQYLAIQHFAKTEKWPFTPRGLFYEIQGSQGNIDPSLIKAFYLTPEFHTIEGLFQKSNFFIKKEHLLDLLLDVDWIFLSDFVKELMFSKDFSVQRRRDFLIGAIERHSKKAARFLIENDRDYVSRKFDDAHVILILDLLQQKTPETEQFVSEMIHSVRSDAVLVKAILKHHVLNGTAMEDSFDLQKELAQFRPALPAPLQEKKKEPEAVVVQPVKAAPVAIKEKKKPFNGVHTVQEGESLWRIARQYGISIQTIKEFNYLDSDRVHPGQELIIPEH